MPAEVLQQADNPQLQVVPDAPKSKPNAIRALKSQAGKRELIAHAFAFEQAAFDLLQEFRKAKKEEDGSCDDSSREDAANARKADAGCFMAITKGWDTALERLRVLKGSPLPGSRRPPTEMPKPSKVKPKNEAPDMT